MKHGFYPLLLSSRLMNKNIDSTDVYACSANMYYDRKGFNAIVIFLSEAKIYLIFFICDELKKQKMTQNFFVYKVVELIKGITF